MYQYTLTVMDGNREVCTIGRFYDETELEIWASENKGELAKSEEGKPEGD